MQGGEFQRPWKRCSIIAKWPLEVELAMGRRPVPIYVSRGHFALRYEVPKFLPRGGHLCMAVLTIAAVHVLRYVGIHMDTQPGTRSISADLGCAGRFLSESLSI